MRWWWKGICTESVQCHEIKARKMQAGFFLLFLPSHLQPDLGPLCHCSPSSPERFGTVTWQHAYASCQTVHVDCAKFIWDAHKIRKKYILQILLAYLGRDRAMSSHLMTTHCPKICVSPFVSAKSGRHVLQSLVWRKSWDAQGKEYKHIQASTKHISAN